MSDLQHPYIPIVMAGLDPAIHALTTNIIEFSKTWMLGTSPGITNKRFEREAK
jgi:hypothetical protein